MFLFVILLRSSCPYFVLSIAQDVQSFLGKLDLMEDVGSEISGPAISGSAA